MTGEIYLQNGNSFPNALKEFSPMYTYFTSAQTEITNLDFTTISSLETYLEDSWIYKASSIFGA